MAKKLKGREAVNKKIIFLTSNLFNLIDSLHEIAHDFIVEDKYSVDEAFRIVGEILEDYLKVYKKVKEEVDEDEGN